MDEILKLFYKALTVLNTGNERQEAKDHFLSLEQKLQNFQPCSKTKTDFDNVRLSVYRCLGELLSETNEYGQSVSYFVKALQINKTDLTLWFSTARAGVQEGNIELSLCAYKEVLKLNQRHLLALTDAIPIAIALEDFYHAQLWTKELLGLRPRSLVANQALKWFRETGPTSCVVSVDLGGFSLPAQVPMQDFLDTLETFRSKVVVRPTSEYVARRDPTVLHVETADEKSVVEFLKILVTKFDPNAQTRVHVNPVVLEIKSISGAVDPQMQGEGYQLGGSKDSTQKVELDWRAQELLGISRTSAHTSINDTLPSEPPEKPSTDPIPEKILQTDENVDSQNGSVSVEMVEPSISSLDDEPLLTKRAKLQPQSDKNSKQAVTSNSAQNAGVEFVDISSSSDQSAVAMVDSVKTLQTTIRQWKPEESSNPFPSAPVPLNFLNNEYSDTESSATCDPSLKRILKNLESQINYDKAANLAPSTSNDIHSLLTITTRNADADSVSSRNVQKKVPEPVYDELLKFFPVKFHPTPKIRSEQLFCSPLTSPNDVTNAAKDSDSTSANNETTPLNLKIQHEESFDWNSLKKEYSRPLYLLGDVLVGIRKLKMEEIEWTAFHRIHNVWRSSHADDYVLKQTDFTGELQGLWTYIEGSVLREYSAFSCPGDAYLSKSFIKSNPRLLCDIDFFNRFVFTKGITIGRSYFLWSFRSNFCYGICLLLQRVHFAAYQFLNRSLLTFEVLNEAKGLESVTFEYGDLTMKVNLSYLENLLTQVKILFSNLKENPNPTCTNDVVSENEGILATLEPLFDNLSEAKKDVDTLMKNLGSMENCLQTIWKSRKTFEKEPDKFGNFSSAQNKLDVAYLELFLGSYVSGSFNTQDITHHLDKLIEFESSICQLPLEFKMRLVNCLLKILHVTVNRAKMRPVDENSIGTPDAELERFKSLIVKTAQPWVILAKLIEAEEKNSKDDPATLFLLLSPESKEESQLPMFIKFLMEGHEYYKELGFCYFSDGILMHRIIQHLSTFLNSCVQISPNYRKVYEQEIDQCYFCLYQLKRFKSKPEIHCHYSCTLEAQHIERVFIFFLPSERAGFNNKKSRLTNDEATMFKRILNIAVPDFCDLEKNIITTFNRLLSHEDDTDLKNFLHSPEVVEKRSSMKYFVKQILHLLADHFMHSKETEEAVKYYTLTIYVDPENVDCWIGISLCRKSLIEFHLLDIEDFPPISEVTDVCAGAFTCFNQSLKLLDVNPESSKFTKSTILIELGLLYYQLSSFIRRSELYQTSTNTYENDASCQTYFSETSKCFGQALQICSFEDKWLCHYMLGKVLEKINVKNPQSRLCETVLNYYWQAILLLDKMGAKIPKKIAVQSPQQHSVEMLEMIYRLFTSALKMMAPHNCSTIGKYIKKIMTKPVIEKHLFKDDETNASTSQSNTVNPLQNAPTTDLAPVRAVEVSGDVISVTSESNEAVSSEDSVRCCSPPMKEVDAKVSMLKWCTEVFKSCAKRYPRHAKSLYRLAEVTATKMRDPEAALRFLYFPEVTSSAPLVPLLSFNSNHSSIVFSSIYRATCHEVDRCGSYYYTIGKSVLLAVDLLVQLGALDELAVFAKSLSRTGDKFYMHEPVRHKIYSKTLYAFWQISFRELEFLPVPDSLPVKDQHEARKKHSQLAAAVFKFIQLKLSGCELGDKMNRSLKKVMLKCYFRCQDDLDYSSVSSLALNLDTAADTTEAESHAANNASVSKKREILETASENFAMLAVVSLSSSAGTQKAARLSFRAQCCTNPVSHQKISQGVDEYMKSESFLKKRPKKGAITQVCVTSSEGQAGEFLESLRTNCAVGPGGGKVPRGWRSSILNSK